MSTPPPPPAPGTIGAATTGSLPGGATGAGAHVHAALPPHAGQAHPPPPPPKPNMLSQTWANRGKITFGLFLAYSSANFFYNWRLQQIRDTIPPNTILHWRIIDGSIVETDTDKGYYQKALRAASGDSPAPVSTLIDTVTAIKHAKDDPRIVGIMANFSSANKTQQGKGLGLAQIQELRSAIQEFKEAKAKALGGEDKVSLIAYTDSFDNQMQYYLASVFDKVYMQPTGSIPLVGLSSTVPFFKTLLGRFGIQVRAEARKEYKSMVSPFTETELPPPQKQNLFDLLKGLNAQILADIAKSRARALGSDPVEKLNHLIQIGPFMGSEAKDEGLVDGLVYKRDCGKMIEKQGAFGLAHYMRVKAKEHTNKLAKTGEPSLVVGIVYLIGGIKRGGGDFGANTIVKGIREAANDPAVDAVVLRIDSGGGDVVASDTIGDAIRWCQDEKKKPVIVSFGNTSASGGYFISTHAKAIMAQPTTVTGSIGVASLRPYFTPEFFKLIGVSVEQFFTGSSDTSLLNDLEGAALTRYKRQIDTTYSDFVKRVADGRKLTIEQVENVAGGRVMNGKEALKAGLVDKLGGLSQAIRLAGDYGLEAHKAAGHLPSDMQVENIVVKVFPKPKPWLQQIVESMTGDEAVDMYAKEKIRAMMMRVWSGDFGGLIQEMGLGEEVFGGSGVGQQRMEIEDLRVV
ncbi:protease IV with duplicated peptidase family U7 domain-containing protein [Linnemannia elongata AG-77]|uniref:Protease IV with duplicated peptidase family U7 domain-containing protein n=1 Tax=Linnemannia elongata AG-77 TaxID=1314771 RepID=A0A197JRY9_9FUNG|nr:protease IV with duplicated peptidase family U7 domain-containing protein [Linnemannia elongata AG-77]